MKMRIIQEYISTYHLLFVIFSMSVPFIFSRCLPFSCSKFLPLRGSRHFVTCRISRCSLTRELCCFAASAASRLYNSLVVRPAENEYSLRSCSFSLPGSIFVYPRDCVVDKAPAGFGDGKSHVPVDLPGHACRFQLIARFSSCAESRF